MARLKTYFHAENSSQARSSSTALANPLWKHCFDERAETLRRNSRRLHRNRTLHPVNCCLKRSLHRVRRRPSLGNVPEAERDIPWIVLNVTRFGVRGLLDDVTRKGSPAATGL